jgi:hypothetical protein
MKREQRKTVILDYLLGEGPPPPTDVIESELFKRLESYARSFDMLVLALSKSGSAGIDEA